MRVWLNTRAKNSGFLFQVAYVAGYLYGVTKSNITNVGDLETRLWPAEWSL